MGDKNYFKKYTLCSSSLDKLNTIEDQLVNIDSKMLDAWRALSWENPEEIPTEENDENDSKISDEESNEDTPQDFIQPTQVSLTQPNKLSTSSGSIPPIEDLTELLCKSLEHAKGKLDSDATKYLADSESSLMNDLSKRLSHNGIYNLCTTICSMEIKLSERFITRLCRDVLVNSILALKEPSRLLNASITECMRKFPDDIENLIFVPVLNFDLKEVTIIHCMTSGLNVQQKRSFIVHLSSEVKDLKQWHISVLQDLLVSNLDDDVKEKVLNLLWKKSYDFANNKNFGKLVLNLIKTNPPTTEYQKQLFEEIVAVHDTLFKKLITKILEAVPNV